MQRQQQQEGMGDWRTGCNLVIYLATCLAQSVEVFLHRRFGERYLNGKFLVGALVLMALFPELVREPGQDPFGMYWFIGAWMFALLLQRAGIARRKKRGDREDAYYTGTPWLWAGVLRRVCGEQRFKAGVEPLVCFLIGCFLLPWSVPAGAYVMISSVCLLYKVSLERQAEDRVISDMEDAMWRQKYLAERFRERTGR